MIKISDAVVKKQENFWNGCLFHPTDAIEDPWGKRILDRMAADGSIHTVRIYTMFEDILYLDEHGALQYDFRVSDLRLDYMIEKGYNLLLAYGGMPDCIARTTQNKTSVSFNKTRYKGKMWNSAPPKDYALWEEVCYQYTKHIVERYGLERVSQWHMQCFNEADIPWFFMSELPPEAHQERLVEYCKLYEAFERGIRKVSDDILIGGPALATFHEFLGGWLDHVREKQLKLDFISVHNYGMEPPQFYENKKIAVSNNVQNHLKHLATIKEHGFENTPIIIDEWGMASGGFVNRSVCAELMRRETEVFSAYFAKLIHHFIYHKFNVKQMLICLSGQHEMTEDFTGFRNFFTLNFIAKPIYNAYILASKLKGYLLDAAVDNENVFMVPTKDEKDNYAVLLTYASEHLEEDIPTIEETVTFETSIKDKQVTMWCIDKKTTNPCRLHEKLGIEQPTEEQIRLLQEEGRLKPVFVGTGVDEIKLELSPNATYLITVE